MLFSRLPSRLQEIRKPVLFEGARIDRLLEESELDGVLKGRGFSRAAKSTNESRL
jgi:hypothetical protein